MLLGVADAAEGKGIHTDMPPERWQKMSSAKKQKAIRMITLPNWRHYAYPQTTLRALSGYHLLLVEHDGCMHPN
jgi:hypothetical protein